MDLQHAANLNAIETGLGEIAERITESLDLIDADTDIDAGTIEDMCAMYLKLGEIKEALTASRGRVHESVETFKNARILEKLDAMGTEKVAIPSLRRSFYPRTQYSARMLDKPAALDWLRANGGASLISETVNHQSLTAFVKSLVLEDAFEPPLDLFSFSSHRFAGSSTYTPK